MSFDPIAPAGTYPVAENIAHLKQLFPEAFTEGRIDFNVLRQLLGAHVDSGEEKYGLNWHGKRRARHLALTPSTGTLLPCPADSVDWENTQNLMIEGDNLEVLKLLQKSYAGKVKLIYIDPPYNTGQDFVYPDDFTDSIKNYLELTGQVEGGKKISSNTDASGRFHTDWLNMMYPRLKLARSLLRDDGIICISINHAELSNTITVSDDIFGEENRIAIATWKARVKPINIGDAIYKPQNETEYVVIYQKTDKEHKFRPLMSGGVRSYPFQINARKYRTQTILKSNRGKNFRSTMSFEFEGFTPPDGQRWQASEDEIQRLHQQGYLEFKEGTPFRRYFEDEEGAEHDPFYCFMDSEWSATSEAGKHELNSLLGNEHGFDTVKPTRLIRTLIQSITPDNDECFEVLDFFAGSGTTAHSVMIQNSITLPKCRFTLVQIPELLDGDDKDQATTARFCDSIGKPRTIAELTKERLRRAGAKIKSENPLFTGDVGFRVFKLAPSNIRAWNPAPEALETTLLEQVEHLLPGRSDDDVLFELLLKVGHDLCAPVAQREIAGHKVYAVDSGKLIACFSSPLALDHVAPLAQGMIAWHKELQGPDDAMIIFRDSAFVDDVVKTNMAETLKQAGLKNLRSL